MLEKLKWTLLLIILLLSFGVVYVKTETTLVGYEIGRLKDEEQRLMSKKSRLQTELAKITDRQNLREAAVGTKQSKGKQ